MLKLVTAPNSVLHIPTQTVKTFDEKLKNLIQQMEQILIAQVDPQGVGLAATQVGSNLAIFIIKPGKKAKTEVFINPKIINFESKTAAVSPFQEPTLTAAVRVEGKKKKKQPLEGCLSIPRIWSHVKRSVKVSLEYQDLSGEVKQTWFSGLKSTIVQHEVDHLNGILFTQRALEQKSQMYEERNGKLKKIEY